MTFPNFKNWTCDEVLEKMSENVNGGVFKVFTPTRKSATEYFNESAIAVVKHTDSLKLIDKNNNVFYFEKISDDFEMRNCAIQLSGAVFYDHFEKDKWTFIMTRLKNQNGISKTPIIFCNSDKNIAPMYINKGYL